MAKMNSYSPRSVDNIFYSLYSISCMNTKPKIILAIYNINRLRMERITSVGLHMSRTAWINAAIREKLDRDHPETVGPEGSPSDIIPPPMGRPPANAEARKEWLESKAREAAPIAKLAEDQEDDFWGDEAYERTKAALRRLGR